MLMYFCASLCEDIFRICKGVQLPAASDLLHCIIQTQQLVAICFGFRGLIPEFQEYRLRPNSSTMERL